MASQSEKKMWFAPKTYGYGTGLPISWEGWVVLALFFAGLFGIRWLASALLIGGIRVAVIIAGMILLLLVLGLICHDRTEGGWRWRDGDDS